MITLSESYIQVSRPSKIFCCSFAPSLKKPARISLERCIATFSRKMLHSRADMMEVMGSNASNFPLFCVQMCESVKMMFTYIVWIFAFSFEFLSSPDKGKVEMSCFSSLIIFDLYRYGKCRRTELRWHP